MHDHAWQNQKWRAQDKEKKHRRSAFQSLIIWICGVLRGEGIDSRRPHSCNGEFTQGAWQHCNNLNYSELGQYWFTAGSAYWISPLRRGGGARERVGGSALWSQGARSPWAGRQRRRAGGSVWRLWITGWRRVIKHAPYQACDGWSSLGLQAWTCLSRQVSLSLSLSLTYTHTQWPSQWC